MEPTVTIYDKVNRRQLGQTTLARITVLPKPNDIVVVNGREYKVVTVDHLYSSLAEILTLEGIAIRVQITEHQADVDDIQAGR